MFKRKSAKVKGQLEKGQKNHHYRQGEGMREREERERREREREREERERERERWARQLLFSSLLHRC